MLTCLSDISYPTKRHVMACICLCSGWHLADVDRHQFRDINFVIMDYLINEGYPSAAKKFALEANIQPKADIDSIQERVEIRNAIHGGDIQSAIEKINELNPQVGRTLQAAPTRSGISALNHIML